MMIVNRELNRGLESELKRVVEPLASYLCASERPRTALLSALEFLFSEVAQTNRAASAQVNAFAENHWS